LPVRFSSADSSCGYAFLNSSSDQQLTVDTPHSEQIPERPDGRVRGFEQQAGIETGTQLVADAVKSFRAELLGR
jgi:hypothetical protein